MTMHQLPHRDVVHLADIHPRQRVFSVWERYRHRQAHWFVECIAEFMGVFFYVYAGVGSTAGFVIGSIADESISSLQTIGFAYAFGILFALITCAATSGGHFNPAVTICHVVLRGFPIKKACRYIFFQILGAFVSALLIYAQWRDSIVATEAALHAAGKWDAIMFTPQGLAGIFALYSPVGLNLGQAFLNEFVCDFLIAIIIWACIDPTNFLVPPAAGPWVVALAYTMCIWGYSPNGLSTNAARDVGTRLAAIALWGTRANGGPYAAIAALTNIPATLLGACFYEFILADSARVVTPGHVDYLVAHTAHEEHGGVSAHGTTLPDSRAHQQGSSSPKYDEKADVVALERV
ncbi:aquaporin-like protein [Phanerochaete sordida]|uniref:Aquaporin-like protein n=1 Tax=Phanerochaete sordida TaxID=48140 RepID=A0A9P3GQU9_9APHY|nr:aquaporin-like protein [Phanerochaete sordida]